MFQKTFFYLVGFGYLLLALTTAWAQVTTSSVRGTVLDPSGAILPGANLTITNTTTGFTRTTTVNSDGVYTFTDLPIGDYKLKAQFKGFKDYEQTGIILSVGEVLGLNLTLQVGSSAETVTVSGGVPVVNTQTSELSTVIDSQQIEELPLNGRNAIQLATLTTGINAAVVRTVIAGSDSRSLNFLSVDGNYEVMTDYLLDGGIFEDPQFNGAYMYPNPDAIEQFQFITNMYSAEYGKGPGGVMNVVSKTGTNQFHGSAWEFNRNSAVGARNYFLPTVPFLNQNQFGFTAGGPIKRDRVFMFASTQWLRVRQGAVATSAFPPTTAERQGNFSADPTPIIDPNTGKPFPNNIIPASRLDPVYQRYLKIIPLPNFPDGSFRGSFPSPSNDYQVLLKPDANLTAKQLISATVYWDRTLSTSPLDFGRFSLPFINTTGPSVESNNVNVTTAILNHVWNMTPNALNNVRFQYLTQNSLDGAPGRGPTMQELGANYPSFPLQDIPDISVPARYFYGSGNFTSINASEYLFADNVTYIRGAHSIKSGIQYLRNAYFENYSANNAGVFFGTGNATGNPVADLDLGHALSYVSNNQIETATQGDWAFFAQDDYRAARRLTLNLGLRYEFANSFKPRPYFSATNGGLLPPAFSFIPGKQSVVYKNAPPGLVFPYSPAFHVGDPGVPSTLAFTDMNGLVPRIGFAWDLFGTGKTVVRGGFGVFKEIMNENAVEGALTGPPYLINFFQAETSSLVNAVASLVGKFPVQFSQNLDFSSFYPLSQQFLDPHFRNPAIYQTNFLVQQGLGSKASLQIAYVGNFSRHLYNIRDINQPNYIPGVDPSGNPLSTIANEGQRMPLNRPFLPTIVYGQVGEASSDSSADYNALQVQLRTQTLHGISLLTSYTWSKAIDFGTIFETTGTTNGLSQNSNCLRCERGLSNLDHRNIFNASLVYDFPSVTGLGLTNPIVKEIVDNWEATTIINLIGGSPFTVMTGTDNSLTGENNDRPNLVGNPYLSTSRPRSQLISGYYNPAAFAPNAIGTFGNEGRNSLIGPGLETVDSGLYKNVPIEKVNLQLRFEFYNLFNRPNFGNPGSTLSSPSLMGVISSAGPGRIIQFGGKLSF